MVSTTAALKGCGDDLLPNGQLSDTCRRCAVNEVKFANCFDIAPFNLDAHVPAVCFLAFELSKPHTGIMHDRGFTHGTRFGVPMRGNS